jgi:hypothetical protein
MRDLALVTRIERWAEPFQRKTDSKLTVVGVTVR